MDNDIIVIGGGAAGMMAAISAAERGANVTILEKNERLGKKLSITGKGRCNVTNNCDLEEAMENIPRNPRFLYSALSQFTPYDTINFFEDLGVPLKTERGQRVFPVSDKASDIVDALERRLRELDVKIVRGNARSFIFEEACCRGVNTFDKQLYSSAVILASGGASYPKTGSDGFGYALAESVGHTIEPIQPSLSALVSSDKRICGASGLTLKNAGLKVRYDNKVIYEDFGEVAFTTDGLGGATILSASANLPCSLEGHCLCVIDIKPALSQKQLDSRILREIKDMPIGTFSELLRKLLPKELVAPVSQIAGVPLEKRASDITKSERAALVSVLKELTVPIKDFRPIGEAVVTRGGVNVKEIYPKTMESKLCGGLYFAGEIIDVDAYTGGFNLQIAFATGRLAGKSAAGSLN